MKKEMNYTIEFYRFMLAINYCLVHCLMVFPMFVFGSNVPFFYAGLDVIVPFMAFSGYFLMRSYEKQANAAKTLGLTPSRQAWNYLKSRLIGLGPAFVVASVAGFIMLNVWNRTPIGNWFIHFLNAIFEWFGLQITGLGFGSPSVGEAWYPAPGAWPPVQVLASPLWFISGLFVAGFMVYYLLAANKDRFIGIIAPVSALVFYANYYLGGALKGELASEQPMWYQISSIGDLHIAQGWPEMFVGLSLGCLVYVAVDRLKDKQFSKGTLWLLTIVQIICTVIVVIRSWIPIWNPIGIYFNMDWAAVHAWTLIFTFLVLLNKDYCTRFPLFSSKIWRIPGRLSFYFYMLHWPIIYIVALCLGMHDLDLSYITMDNMMEVLPDVIVKFILLFGISLVVSLIVAYLFMQLDQKKIQPWLKNKPWYSKEQKELEKAEEAAIKEKLAAAAKES